jgi:outer membrane lipoprotein SlyB
MIRNLLLPLLLAAGLAACDAGTNPGYVNGASSGPVPGGTGRVVAINDVQLRGSGGSGGMGRGTMIGGGLGAASGAAIGAVTSQTLAGGIIGGLLGAVGGAIAGTIADNHGGAASGGRGIEVTVQRDDGQTVRVAQRDDGDVQLGDRVQIVQDRRGVAKVVRDTSRTYDRTASGYGPPQNNGTTQYGGGQDYNPPPPPQQDYRRPDYRQPDYEPPQGRGGAPQPQDDPRYGNLN